MFEHRFEGDVSLQVRLHWFLLSFSGGCINAGGFLATGRFVSHVTGFATLFGADIVDHDIAAAIGILSVPFFFLAGAFIAGMLIDRPVVFGKRPRFDIVMGLCSLCLFIAASGGALAQFGVFGSDLQLKEVYFLLALLCLACGLQNGAITSSSKRSVRTTHLTGLTTDLGLGLAKLMSLDRVSESFQKEWRSNRLRIGSICSFIFGSAVGALFFHKFGFFGFLLPAFISLYAAYRGYHARNLVQAVE